MDVDVPEHSVCDMIRRTSVWADYIDDALEMRRTCLTHLTNSCLWNMSRDVLFVSQLNSFLVGKCGIKLCAAAP